MRIIIGLILLATSCVALDLKCTHQINSWTSHGHINECLVYNISATMPDEPITSVELKVYDYFEQDSKPEVIDEDKIVSFYIYQSPFCRYVPTGIAKYFKNIKVLVIAYTGLKTITQNDLKPLQKLQDLYIDNNQIESLEDDLFLHNPSIEVINLANNKIKSVGFNVFVPLTKLKGLGMGSNICIDQKATNELEVKELTKALQEKCLPVHENAIEPSKESEVSDQRK